MSVRRVAEKANVSIATVSRVMKDDAKVAPETRRRVLQAASQLGYGDTARPAEPCIGLAFAAVKFFSEYERLIVEGLKATLDEQRLDLRLVDIDRDKQPQESYTQFFLRKGLRGVVLRTVGRARQVCIEIAREGFPHIVVAEEFDDPAVNYVVCDSQQESLRAVEHLIELGHRRIAFGTHLEPDRDHRARESAYRTAHERAEIPVDPRLIVQMETNIRSGAAVFNRVMSLQDPPTAIVLADPALTAGVVRRAAEVGLSIPAELSVVGFDDAEMRQMFYPRVSAVCQDSGRLGALAAGALLEIISGQAKGPIRRCLRATFEVNGSTGLAPAIPVRVLPTGDRAPRAETVSAAAVALPAAQEQSRSSHL